jgi:hypothetical protein
MVNEHDEGKVVDMYPVSAGASQYVMFSDEVVPHVLMRNVQQTPKPSAHDPELAPPLSLHSALV